MDFEGKMSEAGRGPPVGPGETSTSRGGKGNEDGRRRPGVGVQGEKRQRDRAKNELSAPRGSAIRRRGRSGERGHDRQPLETRRRTAEKGLRRCVHRRRMPARPFQVPKSYQDGPDLPLVCEKKAEAGQARFARKCPTATAPCYGDMVRSWADTLVRSRR